MTFYRKTRWTILFGKKMVLSCKKCPKFYTSEFSLNHHQKIHDEKKHTCTIRQKSSTIDKAYRLILE